MYATALTKTLHVSDSSTKKKNCCFPYPHTISKHALSKMMIKTLSISKDFVKVNTRKTAKVLDTAVAYYLND